MNTGNTMIIFGDKRPDSCFISDIYDPDIHGIDVEKSGKILPIPGSLATDGTGLLYYVDSVNPITLKSTFKPCRLLVVTDPNDPNNNDTSRLDYGNDRFVLRWDDRTNPYKLEVDSSLVVFGSSNVEYRITRYNEEGEEEVISLYLDSDGKFKGNRIPVTLLDSSLGAKHFTNCHTLHPMKNGDIVYLEVFNSVGMLSAKFTLFTERSPLLNDLSSDANPIMKFDATCLQMRNNDEWYIYEKQDPSHLGIQAFIEFADGSKKNLVIDKDKTAIYGLEDYIPSFPGYRQRIMLKYFLNYKQVSPYQVINGKYRYLTVDKYITVIRNNVEYSVKVSVFPLWDNALRRYTLKFFMYSNHRDKVYDVTDKVIIESGFTGIPDYKEHCVTFKLKLDTIFGTSTTIVHRQNVWLTLYDPSEYQKYILKDSENADKVYGVESSLIRRPVIHYDKNIKQYFIPTSIFKNKEAVIESFYTMGCPPYDSTNEIIEPTPTHFTIRSMDSAGVLIMIPIEIEQYEQAWNITRTGDPSQLVGKSVIVEFLRKINDDFTILYGVPVDVHPSATGYNTEDN